ncbi:MAG: hypothetical protein KAJ19_11495 [Gammaproteobacteria bacterium]|nr:hypothetical protein [Gammaproteobacteria bacterium]
MMEIIGAKRIERKLGKLSKKLSGEVENALWQIGRALEKETKRNVSNKLLQVRSGRLLGSIEHDVFLKPGKMQLVVSSDTPYSWIQNWGGRTGRNHAATITPTYYMSRTPDDKRRVINTILRRALKRAIQ